MGVIDHVPPRFRGRVQEIAARLTASIWVGPAVAGVVGAALALVLLSTDFDLLPELRFLDVEAARAAITTVVSATVAATSLVVTGTIVALQLASGQYSPRLLRDALQDRGIQWVLSVLVGSVTFGLVVVPRLGGDSPPQLVVLFGVAIGVLDMAMLVAFLHVLVQRLRLEAVIGGVIADTTTAIERVHPMDHEVRDVTIPDDAVPLLATRSGYVQDAGLEQLSTVAAEHGVDIHLRPRVGAFLVLNTVLAYVWPADDRDPPLDADQRARLTAGVDRAIAVGVDRTVEGDPAYGIRHLVDIALRGVSPGVNDPTTAVQCIDHATALLVDLARRPLSNGVVERDGCVAVVSRPDLARLLELAQSQILLYGGSDPWVVEALLRQLGDLLEADEAGIRARLIQHHVDIIRTHITEHATIAPHARTMIDAAFDRIDDKLAGRVTDDDDTPAA